MNRSRKLTRSAAVRVMAGVAAIALLLITVLAQPASGGLWLRTLTESLHVPVFGVIAICVLIITPLRWSRRKRLLVAMLGTVILGALSEIAQIPTARDASLSDLIADSLGAAGFLIAAMPFSSGFAIRKGHGRYLIMLGMVIVAWPLVPLMKVSAAYIERNQSVPTLVRFDAKFGRTFFRLQDSDTRKIAATSAGAAAAEIAMRDGPWPGIVFHDLWPDWDPFAALVIDLENPAAAPLSLNISIYDRAHGRGDRAYRDRFNRKLQLAPGVNTIRIDTADIRDAPAGRSMDMADIDGMVIFGTRKEAGRKFLLREIRLE